MPADAPTILATSAGFASDRRRWITPGPMFTEAIRLAEAPTRPRLCYLGTAVGDQLFRRAMVAESFQGTDVELSTLALFPMPSIEDMRGHLLAQDVVWVDGGSVAGLLAMWRLHGLDEIMREAWEAGVVLAGVSAGSICWHIGGTTDSFGPTLRPITDGLGLLPYSNGVHYDSEEQRRPLFHQLIASGLLPEGYATDDGVGLVYRGIELVEAVADREGPGAYHVTRTPDGEVTEERIEPRLLAP